MVILLRYNWFILFEFTLYIFWLIRIYHTFKFSVFEFKKSHTFLIAIIAFILCTIFVIVTSIAMTPKYKEVDMSLSQLNNGFDCEPEWDIGGIFTVYILGQIMTLIFNLFSFLYFL